MKALITSVGYGPYDNSFLIFGLSSGYLFGFDPADLSLVLADQIF
jgi:hypothetical protein